MGKYTARCGILLTLVSAVCPTAGGQSPGEQLTNPAALPAAGPAAPLSLPATPPSIQLASYWRSAKPVPGSATTPSAAAHAGAPYSASSAGPAPPEPSSLVQPAWMLPGVASLDGPAPIEPIEPPGEAVLIEDVAPETSINEVIELAMARLELAPPRSTALLVVARELAVDASTIGDFGDVVDQCHRALDAGPDKPTALALANLAAWAYNRRGELVANGGDEHAAFEDFQEALRLDPDCWPALHNRGVTLARYAQQTEALADFNRVVELAPNFVVARYNRGEVLGQLVRWQEAVDDYTVALKSMPDEASLYTARGFALHQLQKTTEAVSDFNTAIRLDDTQSDAYVGRGNLYAAERLYEQAAADFQQALRLDRNSATAYRSVAWLLATCPLEQYQSGGKAVEAAHRFAKLLGEESPMVLDTLAVAYAGAGDFRKAITYEQQAIVLASETDRPAYEARLALYRRGEPYRTK